MSDRYVGSRNDAVWLREAIAGPKPEDGGVTGLIVGIMIKKVYKIATGIENLVKDNERLKEALQLATQVLAHDEIRGLEILAKNRGHSYSVEFIDLAERAKKAREPFAAPGKCEACNGRGEIDLGEGRGGMIIGCDDCDGTGEKKA